MRFVVVARGVGHTRCDDVFESVGVWLPLCKMELLWLLIVHVVSFVGGQTVNCM